MNWTSGNEKIDNFIQEMQLKINNHDDIVPEWIPYNQFNNNEEIGKDDLDTKIYLAKWKDGPLCYNSDERKYKRVPNKTVVLKLLLDNSQYEFLNKV